MSAVAGAAYRAGQALEDERTGEAHDYTRRGAVDHTEILAPTDAPSWTQDRGRLWNEVEAAETRSNSQVAREVVVALPVELDAGEQRRLVRGFVGDQCVSRGMVADVAYHDIGSGNPHAHVLLTTRRIGPDGFAGKDRSWNDRGLVEDWRREWAAHVNHALARNGERERIDHRSLVSQRQDALDRGDQVAAAELDRPAGVHLGRAVHQEMRTGRPAERVARTLEEQPDRTQLRSLREQLVEQERALEREQPELRPSGLERLSPRDRGLRQTIEKVVEDLLECVRELMRALEAQRERRRQRERALEVQREREAEARRQRDLRAALREYEELVKAGKYEAADHLAEQVIEPAKQWGELNKDREAKDRYEAVRELRWKRSYDQRVGTASNVTDEDISRAVAERTYDRDRDYGPSR
ncbi:MAG: MobA/MobL family protein [Acidobacteria bacterium]|nr:MobA/MobL family protein [Acidobacteriota bacterium]